MRGFVLTVTGVVPTGWIDRNGHMNVTSYMALFDQGTEVFLQRSGLLAPDADSDRTVVAGRIFIEHRKELMEGEGWELWSGFSALAPSFVTVTHRLRGGASLRAVCDIRGAFFSKSTRTAVNLQQEHLGKAGALLVPGLVDRFGQRNGAAV